jgi:hypothetical protein
MDKSTIIHINQDVGVVSVFNLKNVADKTIGS